MVTPGSRTGGADEVLPLAVAEHGTADRYPVVVLHGLFGSGRNWMSVARRLSGEHLVLAPDLRNHGSSPWSETMTYDAMAADVVALLSQRPVPVSLIGHSMGGKAAMLVALRRPDLVDRLVIVDVAPVTYTSTFQAYARAMRAADLSGVTRRAEVDRQLEVAVPDRGVRAFLLQNLVLEPGGARWRVNLPVLERSMSTISGFPDIPHRVRFEGPTLFIAGGRSDYIRDKHADAVLRLFPAAQVRAVPEAGHWVHAERMEDFLSLVEPFLDRTGWG